MEGSSVKLTPLARSNATVNLEAVPDLQPKADDGVRLWMADHTHRRRHKSRNGFEHRGTPFLTRRPTQLAPFFRHFEHPFETRTHDLNRFRNLRHNT
jgi:hypothetical protein